MLHQVIPLALLGLTATAQAADLPQTRPAAQSPLTADDLYQACTQNQAETLPNPFTDVSPDHWAYKSVLTMHYCGAFRQAAPRRLFERSLASPQQSVMPPQPR